jgi:phosphate-selective porin OprO/OprP
MALFNTLRAASSVAAIAAGLMAVSVPAYADMESLLEKLLAKGILSQDEFNEMRQDVREARREAAMEKGSKANSAKTELQGVWKDGFGFTTGDGQHSIKLIGRLNMDYRFKDGGNYGLAATGANDRDTASLADGFEMRRARIGFQGFMYKDINYLLQLNMTGNAPIVDEGYANFAFYKPVQLTVGRFKQPFGLEQLTSSNGIDFAERSYVDQNGVPAKKLGAMISGEPKKGVVYAVSIFQEGFNEITEADGEGKRYAGRVAANFGQLFNIRDTVLHVGFANVGGAYQLRPTQSSQTTSGTETVTRASVVDFRSMNRGFQHMYRAQLAGQDLAPATCTVAGVTGATCSVTFNRTGAAGETAIDVDSNLWGLEAATAYKSFKLQGEYSSNDIDAQNAVVSSVTAGATTNNSSGTTTIADVKQTLKGTVDTYYLQGVWNITGEKWADRYEGGVFKGIKPMNNFKPGSGWGAFQLGVRYSKYDASSIDVTGSGSRIQSGKTGVSTAGALTANLENTTSASATSGSATVANNTGTQGGKMNADVESYGVGLNWLLNPNSRLMFEYTRTNFGGFTTPLDTDVRAGNKGAKGEDLYSIRAQFNF